LLLLNYTEEPKIFQELDEILVFDNNSFTVVNGEGAKIKFSLKGGEENGKI